MRHRLCIIGLLTLMVPVMTFAHENHRPHSPDHPIDSPDYHEVESSVIHTVSNDDQQRETLIALLHDLVMQLLARLGLNTNVDERGNSVEHATHTAAKEIAAVGDLVMTTDDTYRYFSSDGLPEYSISGNSYANDPSAQNIDYQVPVSPEKNERPTYYNIPYTFGIALNGVTFEPFAAEWYQNDRDSGWQEDPFVTLRDLDNYNAHVQPSGLYHYHGQPTNLLEGSRSVHSSVIGFASDGFPLYGAFVYEDAVDSESDIIELDSSYELRSGTRSGGPGGRYDGTYNEDYVFVDQGDNLLDECNGRYGVTPEYPKGTYYYVATESYPYIPRCLMGDQDPSFAKVRPR